MRRCCSSIHLFLGVTCASDSRQTKLLLHWQVCGADLRMMQTRIYSYINHDVFLSMTHHPTILGSPEMIALLAGLLGLNARLPVAPHVLVEALASHLDVKDDSPSAPQAWMHLAQVVSPAAKLVVELEVCTMFHLTLHSCSMSV